MGQRVEVYGTTRHDVNGKHGLVTDFHGVWAEGLDTSKSRYSVLLDSGESYKLRPAAVRAERAEAAGGAHAKAKGKGKKKGRG